MAKKDTEIPAVSPPAEPAAAGPAGPGTAEPAAGPLSETELSRLQEQAAQAAENWDKFLRAAADLENYRKRVTREKEEIVRYRSEQMVAALLPVLDNMERALEAVREHGPDNAALVEGLQQIRSQFRRVLEEFGLEEVVAGAGHPFDPRLHEAIGHEPSAEHPEGAVVQQLQRGYKLANRLLRPARVTVSKGAVADAPPGQAGDGGQRPD
jgi:molecular chaperone GrpE